MSSAASDLVCNVVAPILRAVGAFHGFILRALGNTGFLVTRIAYLVGWFLGLVVRDAPTFRQLRCG